MKKGIKQHLVANRYNLNKLVDHETLEGLEISSVDDTWVKIRDSIKASEKRESRDFRNK